MRESGTTKQPIAWICVTSTFCCHWFMFVSHVETSVEKGVVGQPAEGIWMLLCWFTTPLRGSTMPRCVCFWCSRRAIRDAHGSPHHSHAKGEGALVPSLGNNTAWFIAPTTVGAHRIATFVKHNDFRTTHAQWRVASCHALQ